MTHTVQIKADCFTWETIATFKTMGKALKFMEQYRKTHGKWVRIRVVSIPEGDK